MVAPCRLCLNFIRLGVTGFLPQRCHKPIRIRSATCHLYESGIKLTVGFLCLTGLFLRRRLFVYAILEQEIRSDMNKVVDSFR